MSTSRPTLEYVINRLFDSFMQSIHTALPARIEKYNFRECRAEVKPLIKKEYENNIIQELPIITNVPVIWPRTQDGSITFPLNRGDTILIIFSERALENWLSKGDLTVAGNKRKFDLTDAIAIPGLFSFNNSVKTESGDKFELHYKNASIIIDNNNKVDINDGNLTIEL